MTRRLLWTGGWDSTFRLLDLAMVHGESVEPYYLADPGRPSLRMELATMELIRQALQHSNPAAAERITPLTVVPLEEVPLISEVSAAHAGLLRRGHIGEQYEWLARFAHDRGFDDLELSIEKDSLPHKLLARHLAHHDDPAGNFHALNDAPEDSNLKLFSRFRFPLLAVSKCQMQEYAAEHGFAELLERTWFCHHPRHGKPCGVCSPCRQVMESGLARRIPLAGRLRYRVDKPIRWLKGRLRVLKRR